MRPITASAIGTYSMKLPCTRIAAPRSLSPPSKKLIFFFALCTVTRMLTPTSITAKMPMKTAVIGIGMAFMSFLPGLFQHGLQQLAHFRWIPRDLDAAGFHDRELLLRGALAARADGARVAHALARRRGNAGDEADHRLLHVGLDPLRGVLLIGAADLAHHDDCFGLRVVVEHLQHVDVLDAVDRVSADADAGGLPEAEVHELADRLVGERARALHHADPAFLVDVARHGADLEFVPPDH